MSLSIGIVGLPNVGPGTTMLRIGYGASVGRVD